MHVHGVREHTGEVFDGWNKERDGERTDDKVRTRHPLEMQASRIARIGDGMSFEENREGEEVEPTTKNGQGE
jgi:hypothetical protein